MKYNLKFPVSFFYSNSCLFFLLIILFTQKAIAQQPAIFQKYTKVDPQAFADNSGHWYMGVEVNSLINPQPGRPRYQPTEIINIADNILLFQKDNGGWEKNYDVFAILTDAQKDTVAAAKSTLHTTFDNGSIYTQITVLANVFTETKIEKYKLAAEKGLDFIIASQYKNGGWPQYFPLEDNYSRCITYNDGNFTGIMELLGDIREGKAAYTFINNQQRKKLIAAYDKAICCILKTQISDAGKPTAWCQQYDELTLLPAWARKFEPASICNKESADLVIFLMAINNPSKEIIGAINNAVTWFEASKIYNTRVTTIPAERMVTPFRVSLSDRVVVTDSAAPPIWTRFYELVTHRPLFCNRDSKLVYSLAEVLRERRDGYAWYTYSPQLVLDKYPAWKKKWL